MKSDKADFTQGSILKKLVAFMMPVLGALILQAAYGAVDLLVVGRFGSTSGLSAVSTGSQVLNLVTFVVVQFAMGITVLIARYLGEKKPEKIGAVIGGGAIVFTIISVVLFIVMVCFAHPISILMQAPEEAVDLTASYVRICGGGIFFIVAYNLLSAIFRGLGDSKSPLLFVLVACIVNVIGDLALGAGVLHNRSVEMAKKYGVPLVVRSSLNNSEGTVVKEEVTVERMLISGVALDTDAVRIAVIGLKDEPGVAFKLFDTLAKKNINVDVILQSIGRAGRKDISFTVDGNDLDDAVAVLDANQARLGFAELHSERNIAKLSIVGAGMMSNPGVAAKMFESLYNEGVNINMISTSEIRVTVLINEKDGVRAMNAVHDTFGLAD